MKTTLLATVTLVVFSTFTLLTFAGGQERIASFLDHNTALSAVTRTPGAPAPIPYTRPADQVRPIILTAASANEARPAGAQTVWLDGSLSGRPWWLQPREAH
jgi:hypothetical protein